MGKVGKAGYRGATPEPRTPRFQLSLGTPCHTGLWPCPHVTSCHLTALKVKLEEVQGRKGRKGRRPLKHS